MKKDITIKKIKKIGLMIGIGLITLLIFVGVMIIIGLIQEKLLIEDGYDIWLVVKPYSHIIFVVLIIMFAYVELLLLRIGEKSDKDDIEAERAIRKFVKKYKVILITIFSVIFYIIIINVVYIKGDKIVVRSTFSPFGREYTFNDIVEIKAGFRGRSLFQFVQTQGEFYYNVRLSDGTKFDVNNVGREGEKYEGDTYLALEYIDQEILKSGPDINKKVSFENREYSLLDDRYNERFERILKNVK